MFRSYQHTNLAEESLIHVGSVPLGQCSRPLADQETWEHFLEELISGLSSEGSEEEAVGRGVVGRHSRQDWEKEQCT